MKPWKTCTGVGCEAKIHEDAELGICPLCYKKEKDTQDQYLVEEAKKTVISDLHFLATKLGKEETVKWLNSEFIEVIF